MRQMVRSMVWVMVGMMGSMSVVGLAMYIRIQNSITGNSTAARAMAVVQVRWMRADDIGFLLGFTPLLSQFFKFYQKTKELIRTKKKYQQYMPTIGAPLHAMFLHGDIRIEVVEGAIGLGTVWPGALIQALDLIVASTRTFLHCIARQ